MTQLLLILHFIAMAVGVGGSVANMIAGITAGSAPAEARPTLGMLQRRIGIAAAASLALLWITGIWMVLGAGEDLSILFSLKIVAVIILTALSAGMQFLSLRAARSGTPPPPVTMRRLGMAGLVTSLTVVVLAVLSFS